MTTHTHVMVDLETMSTSSYAAIVALGAVKFDPNGTLDPAKADTFYQVISLKSSMKAGLRLDADTVMWWMRQSAAAREAIAVEEVVNLDEALLGFSQWYGNDDMVPVWGNGATFDNVILSNAYQALGIDRPWSYRADRCYRTIKETIQPRVKKVAWASEHIALDDAISQALTLQKIVRLRMPRMVE